jgi:ArsR family transcriptional regulator
MIWIALPFELIFRCAQLEACPLDFARRYFHTYGIMKKSMVIAALGALAQETRLDIFRMLVQQGPEGLPAGEIGSRLAQPSPTMSFHLNQLRFAGMVTSRRESRSIIYRANFKAMNDLLGYLTENCCGGRPELCNPSGATGCGSECAPEPATTKSKKHRRLSA